MISSEDKRSTSALEKHFEPVRNNIVGIDQEFDSPFGRKKIIYTDWTASGRLYAAKPGWIRMSIHPTTTNAEIEFVCDTINYLAENFSELGKEYKYDCHNNEYSHENPKNDNKIEEWFTFD